METITTQGVAMPRLGFGTFRMPGADAQPVVESAIALGYPCRPQRHKMTALIRVAANLRAILAAECDVVSDFGHRTASGGI